MAIKNDEPICMPVCNTSGGRVFDDDPRLPESNQQRRYCKNQAGQWPRHRHIECGAAIWRERLDSDEGAEGSQRKRRRDEIRWCDPDAMATRGEVMAEFVGAKY